MATATMELQPGNWEKFDSFAWFGQPDDAHEYAIVYTHNRDSDIITRSNAQVIAQELEQEQYSEDVIPQDHSHWACGWIKGYAIRVNREGEKTPAAQKWEDFQEQIDQYPILDESHYSNLESEEQEQALDNWALHDFKLELEQFWDEDLTLTGDELRQLWYTLESRSGEYWEGDHIDVKAVAESSKWEEIKPHCAIRGFKLYRGDEFIGTGERVGDEFTADDWMKQELFDTFPEGLGDEYRIEYDTNRNS